MTHQKSPFLLRVIIVVVALLLGLSLNMFQFRNPFRGVATVSRQTSEAVRQLQSSQSPAMEDSRPGPVQGNSPTGQDAALSGGTDSSKERPATVQDKEGMSDRNPGQEIQAGTNSNTAQVPGQSAEGSASVPSTLQSPARAPSAEPEISSPAVSENKTPESSEKPEGLTGAEPKAAAQTTSGTSTPELSASEQSASGKSGIAVGPDALPAQPKTVVPILQGNRTISEPPVTWAPDRARSVGIGREVPAGPVVRQGGDKPSPAPAPAQTGPSAERTPSKPATAREAREADQPNASRKTGESSGPDADPFVGAARAIEQKAGKVLEFKVQNLPGEFVLTIVTDTPVEKVESFHAKSPARLVVDIMGGWQAAGPSNRSVDSDLVEKIRVGVHPDKLRLVMDYKDKDLPQVSEPIIERQPKAVVIRLPKPEKEQ